MNEFVPEVKAVEASEEQPLWSVMIPTYNCAELMEITLQAVLDQDLGEELMHIEVIDDCSTKDDPEEVVNRIGKGRVKFYRHPENVGAQHNFNACIQRSKGTWVHLLHGDDVPLPGFYKAYGDAIAKHPDSKLIVGQGIYLDDHERWFGVSPFFPQENGVVKGADVLFSSSCDICAAATVVARSAYEELGSYRMDLFHTQDWEMWSRLACHGKVAYVDRPYLLYRLHEGNDTSRLRREGLNVIDAMNARKAILKRLEGTPAHAVVEQKIKASIREMSHVNTEELAWKGYYGDSFNSALRTLKLFPSIKAVTDFLKPLRAKIKQSLS